MSTFKVFLNYTDWHDVDEEMRTIVRLGGWWTSGEPAGVFDGDMYNTPTASENIVASSNIKN